jgi:polyisoprenoid-binding protein YceI
MFYFAGQLMYLHLLSQTDKTKQTMKKFILSAVVALAPIVAMAQVKWNLDKSHSSVKFTVEHLVISEVEGSFKMFDGTLESTAANDFTNAKVNFTVDVNSINTDDEKRDGHLKSDDFFNAEKFPKMTFVATSIKKVKGNMYTMEGNLTIRDVTKKVKFSVINGGTVKDPWGNIKTGFKASGKINRKEFGLKWGAVTEAGGAVVGDEVNMIINVEFAQAK